MGFGAKKVTTIGLRPDFYLPGGITVYFCINNLAVAQGIEALRATGERVFGLDCEWNPYGNAPREVALLQIASTSVCILITMLRLDGVPEELQNFLADEKLIKTGVNVKGDFSRLHKDYGIKSDGWIDSMRIVDKGRTNFQYSIKKRSLEFLSKEQGYKSWKDKSVQLSMWSNFPLSQPQKRYAALDAIRSAQIFWGDFFGKKTPMGPTGTPDGFEEYIEGMVQYVGIAKWDNEAEEKTKKKPKKKTKKAKKAKTTLPASNLGGLGAFACKPKENKPVVNKTRSFNSIRKRVREKQTDAPDSSSKSAKRLRTGLSGLRAALVGKTKVSGGLRNALREKKGPGLRAILKSKSSGRSSMPQRNGNRKRPKVVGCFL